MAARSHQGAGGRRRSSLCRLRRTERRSRSIVDPKLSEDTPMSRSSSSGLRAIAAALLTGAPAAFAIDTASITASALSPDCLAYRVVGICFWLTCTVYGCDVETSTKVSHYVPDAVVSSYMATGANP